MSISSSTVVSACPECGHRVRFRLRDVQARRTVTCPAGHRIQLREEGDGIRKIDQAERNLKRSVDNLTRQLRRLR